MPIQPITLDTSELPEERQFEAWARHSRNTVLSPREPGPFSAVARFWPMGSVHISAVQIDPFVSDRTAELLREVPADFIQCVALNAGEVRFEHGGRVEHCRAPDLFLRDYAQTSRAVSGRIDAVVLYVARDRLEPHSGQIGLQGRFPMSAETSVLGAMLRTVSAQLGNVDSAAEVLYSRALRDLLAAALLRWSGGHDIVHKPSSDRFRQAKAKIAELAPGTVSPVALARELGMSRSALFGMFRQHGGVLAYDRLRRLRALYRAISDPTDGRSFTSIAAEYGFTDSAALSRTFKAAFGRSMTEVRADAIRRIADTREPSPAAAARVPIEMLN